MSPEDVGLEIIHISDSFVLSAPIDNQQLPAYSGLVAVAIKAIQLAHQLLNMGFLMRGGIAVGNVYRTPTNIFGTGYQDAYETESTLANAPRLLLYRNATERLESDRHLGYQLTAFPIFMREGGQFILDTLYMHWSLVGENRDSNLVRIFAGYKTKIEQNLGTLPLGSARDKWEWMAKLYNAKQRSSSDLRAVSPIDLDRYSAFEFGPTIEQSRTTFGEAFGQFMAPSKQLKFKVQRGSENEA